MPRSRKTPNEHLAEALLHAKKAGTDDILKHSDTPRPARVRLEKAGYLTEVIKGWYQLSQPDGAGTSTAWFSGFWTFVKVYLQDRFGSDYCLSAESSLNIHAGESLITDQLTVITKRASNQILKLPHSTSLVLYQDEKNFPDSIEKFNGVNIMPLPQALCRLGATYFQQKPLNVEIALKMAPSVAEISRTLLSSHSVASAARIAGAYKTLGDQKKETQIVQDMGAAGYEVKPKNPFVDDYRFLSASPRIRSPYAARIEALWKKLREDVANNFPENPGTSSNPERPIRIIRDLYKKDAYHSLSIEGYQVTEELIRKIKTGEWNPEGSRTDKDQTDALAAKGYLNAFNSVVSGVEQILVDKKSAALVAEENLQNWYRDLFSPSVQAGLVPPTSLAGYRNQPVYINMSRHVPPPSSAVLDSMETLFTLLKAEEKPAVRAVLGHFVFVFIHPYMDGNGRIGRFLMNVMLVSGGYSWTVVRTERRPEYIASLEAASAGGDMVPFTKFIRGEMEYWASLEGKI